MQTISVTQATYLEGYKIKVHFSDCTERILDFKKQINKIRVPEYEKYKDIEYFKTFKIEDGDLVWGEDWDLIFPIYTLYTGKI